MDKKIVHLILMPWKQIVVIIVYIIQLICIIYWGLAEHLELSAWAPLIVIELMVVSIVFGWLKSLDVEYKERKETHRIHHENLIDNVFKQWCFHTHLFDWHDLQKKNGTEFKEFLCHRFGIKDTEIIQIAPVDAKTARVFFNDNFITLNLDEYNTRLSIEIYEGRTEEFIVKEENDKLNIYEINSIDKRREVHALEHLKKYTNLWKLRNDNINIGRIISEDENAIKEYIKNKFVPEVLPDFDWDYTSWETCFFALDDAVRLIYTTVEGYMQDGEIPHDYTLRPQDFGMFGITIIIDKNKKDLAERVENFRKLVEDIIKEETLGDRIEKVVMDKMRLTKKINEFERGISDIIYNFEENNIPLKGTCDCC